MLQIIKSTLGLVWGLVETLWGFIFQVLVWGWELLQYLHLEAPRLEGLLVGVLLAWLLARRDKHPLIRVLSSPLKLIVDILDLIWDQIIEILSDVEGTISGWLKGLKNYVADKIKAAYGKIVGFLGSIKEKLSK